MIQLSCLMLPIGLRAAAHSDGSVTPRVCPSESTRIRAFVPGRRERRNDSRGSHGFNRKDTEGQCDPRGDGRAQASSPNRG